MRSGSRRGQLGCGDAFSESDTECAALRWVIIADGKVYSASWFPLIMHSP